MLRRLPSRLMKIVPSTGRAQDKKLWRKGEESGHVQNLKEIHWTVTMT